MTVAAVTVDAVGALRAYMNGRTTTLVGDGHPLALGVWLGDGPRENSRPRSPYRSAYAVLSQAGGVLQATSQAPFHLPRVSASIYGITSVTAEAAARAYTDELFILSENAPVTVTWTVDSVERSAVIRSIDSITGPLEVANRGPEPRYLVDAVLVCTPA